MEQPNPCGRDKDTIFVPNDSQLCQAAHHIAHDIRMLAKAHEGQSKPFAYTAWFVHCRSVMGFFDRCCTPTKKKDDVCACHYVDDWTAVRGGLEKPDGYERYWEGTNKLAAHLTYSRAEYASLPPEKQVVPSAAITEHLLGVTEVFLGRLPEERQAWFGGLRR